MNFENLKLYTPKMDYRRFGKTEEQVSVITLGGMRYVHGWDDPRHEIPKDTLDQCVETIRYALDMGINLIETAYGYKKSETAYGIALNDVLSVPRDSYLLMTKGNPKTADETRTLVEEQLKTLKTDYFDFYAWHGINTQELLEVACAKGGPVEELLKMKKEGIIKHVGFSTHAPLDVILRAIETDLFDFVNLHYYYFFQRNKPAIDLAASKDMGVFIISPNDKGGQLSKPSEKLKQLTAPATPLQWNARFCLGNKNIHTLTMGLPVTGTFNDVEGICPATAPMKEDDQRILKLMDEQKLLDPFSNIDFYQFEKDPSGLNIPEILRFRQMVDCYDMTTFGEYRYNMFEEKGHWFPGTYPTEESLKAIDVSKCPEGYPLVEIIEETHKMLYKPKK